MRSRKCVQMLKREGKLVRGKSIVSEEGHQGSWQSKKATSTTGAGAISGRLQAGLLALGSMHARFGHTSQALQSLYEAVGIAQQSNDDAFLAHALAALCHLISEVGAPSDAEASELSLPGLNVGNGPSLSVQEQLLLLLNCCL
ncbi:hypothetical protein L7F22_054900 [Adiantum nelumboides]|nr:hypothetical protein [Adiantum nelumboides]